MHKSQWEVYSDTHARYSDIRVEGMTSLREFASWGEVSHLRLRMRMAKIVVLSDEVEIVITQAVLSFFTPGFPGCEREVNPTL